jgi:hypothetical protein
VAGDVRIVHDPEPPDTVSRFAWVWVENKIPEIGYPYRTEAEARRVGRPPVARAVLLELVLPRAEIVAALQAQTT